jgi:hypothetical protein
MTELTYQIFNSRIKRQRNNKSYFKNAWAYIDLQILFPLTEPQMK